MAKDVIDFTPDRQSSKSTSIGSIPPYNNPDTKQPQPREELSLTWIVLAVVVGGIVALAVLNFLAH